MNNGDNPYAGSGAGNYQVSYGQQTTSGSANGDPNQGGAGQSGVANGGMGHGQGGAQVGGPAAAGPVKDITTEQFMSEVVEASGQIPVLVDFWAPWCGPCRQLAPALEKVVGEYGGRVKLVKMNIDEHPQVSNQMGIQSIPAVVAFKDGKPAEAFMGAQPESQIREFIEKLVGPDEGADHETAFFEQVHSLIEANDFATAMEALGGFLQTNETHPIGLALLATAYLKSGDIDRAKAVFETIKTDGKEIAQVSALAAELELAEQAQGLGDLGELEAKAKADPKDYQAHFDLAIAYNASGKRDEATDSLIHVITAKRDWNDEAARKQLLQFFEAWGPTDEATLTGRRKLSSALFS